MIQFITSLRYFYIFIFLFSILYSSVSAKDNSNSEYVSLSENTTIPNLIILTGDEITLNNDGILVVSGENETVLYETRGRIELQASKKIIFSPGTRIVPGEGEFLYASIIEEQEIEKEDERRLLTFITFEFSKSFEKKEKAKGIYNKDRDKESTILCVSKVDGVIDNQQRRTGNIKTVNHHFSANYFTSKYHVFQTISGFKPETVEVLRL